jgi:hypothetical protein
VQEHVGIITVSAAPPPDPNAQDRRPHQYKPEDTFSYPGCQITSHPPTLGAVVPTDVGKQMDEWSLNVQPVSVNPAGRYCFTVKSALRAVVTFCFSNLTLAIRAADDLRKMLPRIVQAVQRKK